MATTYKVLGQSNPGATTLTDLYTVPVSTQTVVSTITVVNQGAASTTYRIAVVPSGDTASAENYIVYDESILPNQTTGFTMGLTLAAGDKIRVYAGTTTMSFNAFGSEIA